MRIILNGSIDLYEDGIDFEDLEIEIVNECDIDECDIEDYMMDCEECGFCDLDDEDEDDEIDIDELVDTLTDVYAKELSYSCLCPECVKDLLVGFIRDFIDLL